MFGVFDMYCDVLDFNGKMIYGFDVKSMFVQLVLMIMFVIVYFYIKILVYFLMIRGRVYISMVCIVR